MATCCAKQKACSLASGVALDTARWLCPIKCDQKRLKYMANCMFTHGVSVMLQDLRLEQKYGIIRSCRRKSTHAASQRGEAGGIHLSTSCSCSRTKVCLQTRSASLDRLLQTLLCHLGHWHVSTQQHDQSLQNLNTFQHCSGMTAVICIMHKHS